MTTDRPVSLADALAANAAKDAAVHADHGPLRQWWAANTAQAPSTSGGSDGAPAASFSARTSSGGLTSALYLFLVGLLVLVVGAVVLFPATSIFAGILGGALMLIGGNAVIGGAIITGPRR